MSRKRVKPKKSNAKDDDFMVEVLKSDMSEELQKEAVQAAKDIFSEAGGVVVQKDLAAKLKKRFDASYPASTWHCIIGNHFASSITHQTKYMIFMNINAQNVLLFKTTE